MKKHCPSCTCIPDKQDRFDFEKLYEIYPKKSGKALGLARCRSLIVKDSDYLRLEQAIKIYSEFFKICIRSINTIYSMLSKNSGNVRIGHQVSAKSSFHVRVMCF